MTGYILRRIFGAVIVMWAVATLVFFMLRILPGDPLAAMLFEADPSAAEELRIKFGLDQPMIVQYWKWFVLMLQGDMGNSIYGSRIPVSQILIEAAPRTLSLALLSFCVSIVIAIPAGLI